MPPTVAPIPLLTSRYTRRDGAKGPRRIVSWLDARAVPDLVLGRSPLSEVICQVRFAAVLRIQHDPLLIAQIQDRLRGVYPNVEAQAVLAIGLPGELQDLPHATLSGRAWRLTDLSRTWVVALANDFVALSTTAYIDWEDFASRLEPILAAVFEVAGITATARIGLRYTNLLDETRGENWRTLIEPEILGWIIDPGERQIVSTIQEVRLVTDVCQVGFRHGLVVDADNHPKYLLDVDCFTEDAIEAVPRDVVHHIGRFNTVADRFFFNAITADGMAIFDPRPKGGPG